MWERFVSPRKAKVYKCPWELEWQKPENIRIIPNPSMVQWLGMDSSLRPEGTPKNRGTLQQGVHMAPPLPWDLSLVT